MAQKLTSKQQKFCDLYVTGSTVLEAYLGAYDVGPDTKMSSKYVAANRVLNQPVVAAMIAKMRSEVAKKISITAETLVAELEEIKQVALRAETPQSAAAVSAVMGKAKLLGLDKQIIEMTGRNGGPIESRMLLISKISEAFEKLKHK